MWKRPGLRRSPFADLDQETTPQLCHPAGVFPYLKSQSHSCRFVRCGAAPRRPTLIADPQTAVFPGALRNRFEAVRRVGAGRRNMRRAVMQTISPSRARTLFLLTAMVAAMVL